MSNESNGVTVTGQLVPPQAARVLAEQPSATAQTTADSLGRFRVTGLTAGPARFSVTPTGQSNTRRSTWMVL